VTGEASAPAGDSTWRGQGTGRDGARSACQPAMEGPERARGPVACL